MITGVEREEDHLSRGVGGGGGGWLLEKWMMEGGGESLVYIQLNRISFAARHNTPILAKHPLFPPQPHIPLVAKATASCCYGNWLLISVPAPVTWGVGGNGLGGRLMVMVWVSSEESGADGDRMDDGVKSQQLGCVYVCINMLQTPLRLFILLSCSAFCHRSKRMLQ